MIDQKAQELGRLLGQSEEYKTLVRASDRMREDATCKKLLAEVERIAQDIERAAQESREPAREQVEQYDRALQSVQSNAVYQQVVAAQANFEKLMAKVNARIYEGMKQGAASPIITLG
ncbi:MAG TPA: YlbF family regulator [Gemmatimonadales bacterium]|nr:YlbF family regulator [Gemmatimonadales bacterium]